MTRLLINVDHVATLRNARRETFPDPVRAAALCEQAGADGIVFHLREDRRHITERDVRLLKATVQGKLDFELSTDDEVVGICCATQPELATLVPERREEVTTEGGLDVVQHEQRLRATVERLAAAVPEVALFVDPVDEQIDASEGVGAHAVELHTGDFANAASLEAQRAEAQRLARAAARAADLGLKVHAGHGLDYHNYPVFRDALGEHLDEVSIGFAIVARAVYVGMEQAVRDMVALVKG